MAESILIIITVNVFITSSQLPPETWTPQQPKLVSGGTITAESKELQHTTHIVVNFLQDYEDYLLKKDQNKADLLNKGKSLTSRVVNLFKQMSIFT